MTFKDDLVQAGLFINQATVLSAQDIASQLSTTEVGAIPSVAIAALATTDLPTLSTTQLGVLNAHLATVSAVNLAIKTQAT